MARYSICWDDLTAGIGDVIFGIVFLWVFYVALEPKPASIGRELLIS